MKNLYLAFIFITHITAAQKYDIVITNGRIVDGTGNPWFKADLGIRNGKIVAIGKLELFEAREVIYAQNKIVSPGFIDVHMHIEESILTNPKAENFLFDGVTTGITGNCGSSRVDLDEFFRELRMVRPGINVGSLIGHNDVREAVMGTANREATTSEQYKMEELVTKAMKNGAFGLATGLIYVPGTYANTSEVVGLAKIASTYGGLYASHIRDEGDQVQSAIDEALQIGREANIPVQISHFKVSSKPKWGFSKMTVDMIERARLEGIDVNVDQYPYTASSTNMGTLLPSWALADGEEAIKTRLTDSVTKAQVVTEMIKQVTNDQRTSYDYAFVANSRSDSSLNGKNISEINLERGRPNTLESEANLICDLVANGGAQMVFHKMNEDDVEHILKYPNTMIASDAGVARFGRGVPHPRAYGTNARVLARYVRDKKVITLEDAVRRMTSLPAQRFKLNDRGILKVGYAADVLIFDENAVQDNATFDRPHAYSTGISHVLVNGKVVIHENYMTGERAGNVLIFKGN
jgi:N-acyl-D-amino-acid deacylase